jgi:hypothetical protein
MNQSQNFEMPKIVWEHAFCTSVAKVHGVPIGRISLRGRPDSENCCEIVLYHSKGEVHSWSQKPAPAATLYADDEQTASKRFEEMVKDALMNGTPSDLLTAVSSHRARELSKPDPKNLVACQIQGELIDYSSGRAGLIDFYQGKLDVTNGRLYLDREDREVSLHVYNDLPVCCIKIGASWDRYQVVEEGVAVLTPEAIAAINALLPAKDASDQPFSLNDYAFDCTLTTALRVKARSREEAEAMIRDTFNAADCNGGAWPNGDPILFEASLNDSKLELYELNGETLDNFGKSAC